LFSPSLGVLVTVAIALHNTPEKFAMAFPAVASNNQALFQGNDFRAVSGQQETRRPT
jgi:hypothetical protein